MHGKARRDSGHHRARAPTLAPKPRAQGSNTARARLAPSPTRAALSGHAPFCSVCGQHLTPPEHRPKAPAPDSQDTPSEADPSHILPETERSLLHPRAACQASPGADTPQGL